MVLLALCDNANDQGDCYPSISMLADKCSMGERTVQQHITDLEKDGVVRRGVAALPTRYTTKAGRISAIDCLKNGAGSIKLPTLSASSYVSLIGINQIKEENP